MLQGRTLKHPIRDEKTSQMLLSRSDKQIDLRKKKKKNLCTYSMQRREHSLLLKKNLLGKNPAPQKK